MDQTIHAFPTHPDIPTSDGMALRDYFAAKAMQSLIITHEDTDTGARAIAVFAYRMADKMMAQRDDTDS